MFNKALRFEHEYPPRWGTSLHPNEFSHIISADFIKRYEHKEIEYKTQPSRRIYCQHMVERVGAGDKDGCEPLQEPCGEFMGVRQRLGKSDILVLGRCKECKNATCMVCDNFSSDPAAILQHICTGKSSANEKRAQAFVGLKRGRNWQQCPSRLCGRRIELSAACNHITCTCGTGFCFICGKEADGDSEHWARRSGCPRYNHPDDRDAEYDDYEEDDDDSVAPEEDADDVLENVRGLFDVDDASDEAITSLPALTERAGEVVVVADVGAGVLSTATVHLVGGGARPEPVIPPANGEPLPTGVQGEDTSRDTPEGGSRRSSVASTVALATEVRENLEREILARHLEPTTAVSPMSVHDAEAIASAYLEDDLSDEERDAYEILINADRLAVTMDDADIDRALWRMRVD